MDDSIVTVTVNFWDPITLEYHGTHELTRYGEYLIGGDEPTAGGNQLVQAYAYDANGKIRAVAEATGIISTTSDSVVLTAKPVRLMGGNVQKTGQSISGTPVIVKTSEIGISCEYATGMTCDGLNIYVSRSLVNVGDVNQIVRQVISSKVVAPFVGGGVGVDEDNGAQSIWYNEGELAGLTTDGRYLYVGNSLGWINRISFSAFSKRLGDIPPCSNWFYVAELSLSTDGAYLYIEMDKLHRLDLTSLQLSHLDPVDWAWKSTTPTASYIGKWGILAPPTTDGARLFWVDGNTGNQNSILCGGGGYTSWQAYAPSSFIGETTDGTILYRFGYTSGEPGARFTSIGIEAISGTGTILSNVSGNYSSQLIATDGVTLFGYAE
jgi:hypothetical protein